MKRTVLFLLLIIASQIKAQDKSDAKLQVKKTIDTFFEGFHKGDTVLVKSVLAKDVLLQTIFTDKNTGKGVLKTDNAQKMITTIGTRPEDQKWDERLLDYSIQIDGRMANAWTPYEFWFNEKFSHCGVNSFQLFTEDNQWKIIYLVDTRQRKDCKQG